MQKITLISDIHNQCDALKYVINNADCRIICLGDIIGYNDEYNPNLTIETIYNNCIDSIAGNWDRMVNIKRVPDLNYREDENSEKMLLKEQTKYGGTVPNNKYYTQSTKNALESIITNVREENKAFLNSLPDTLSINGVYHFIHGGFHETQLKNGLAESSNFEVKQFNYNAFIIGTLSKSQLITGKIIFHGHTHLASILYDGNYTELSANSVETFEIDNKKGAVISLPSLGRKVNKPDFNGYAILQAGKEKTKISFIEKKI
jgi:predicted phosphodiesterase